MWQGKDLREGILGSVAMIGLTGEILGSVASKGVSIEERSFDSLRSLRTRILAGCSFFGSVANKGDKWRKIPHIGRTKREEGSQPTADIPAVNGTPHPGVFGKECGFD